MQAIWSDDAIFDYHRSVRRAVVRKQISLYYKLEADTIYIIRLWNSFQNLTSLKL